MIPSKRKEMKLRTFTWNVCGLDVEHLEAKDAERLDRILAQLTATDADVVCCGLVEVVDLDPGTVLRDSIKTDSVFRTRRVESWRVKCRNALGDGYTEITSGGLVGVALFVFAKPDTLVGVDVSTIATGSLGGALGNKGAVVMRMTPCKSTYFHVVHAHMASDLDQVAARNAEYAQIVNTRCVPEEHSALGDAIRGSRLWQLIGPVPSEGFGVLDADVVIWQGDLNYRLGDEGDAPPPPSPSFARRASVVAGAVVGGAAAVATGVGVAVVGVGAAVAGGAAVGAGATAGAEKLVGGSPEKASTPKEDIWRDVVDAIEKEDWATLRSRDQLLTAIAAGDAFDGFREADLAFPPTYKLIRNDEDALRYKQNRRPAWCDRVIWRGDAVACKAYDCVPSALSDHAPVFADLAWDDRALPPRVAPDNRSAAQTSVPSAERQTSIARGDRSGLGAAGWFGGGGGFV